MPATPAMATLYHNLGGLEHARGRYAEGEPYARRSVAIREAALGPNHLEVAADLAALAGDPGWAGESWKKPRRSTGARSTSSSPGLDTTIIICRSASTTWPRSISRAEMPLLAETYYRWALANREKLLGPDHPDVALTLSNLGVLMQSEGKIEAAESLYQRALRIFERSVTADHPHAVTCARNYADILRQSGRGHDAERLDRRFGGA